MGHKAPPKRIAQRRDDSRWLWLWLGHPFLKNPSIGRCVPLEKRRDIEIKKVPGQCPDDLMFRTEIPPSHTNPS